MIFMMNIYAYFYMRYMSTFNVFIILKNQMAWGGVNYINNIFPKTLDKLGNGESILNSRSKRKEACFSPAIDIAWYFLFVSRLNISP